MRSTLIGYGVLLTLLTIRGADLHRHYLIIDAPIMALWVARLALLADRSLVRTTGVLRSKKVAVHSNRGTKIAKKYTQVPTKGTNKIKKYHHCSTPRR